MRQQRGNRRCKRPTAPEPMQKACARGAMRRPACIAAARHRPAALACRMFMETEARRTSAKHCYSLVSLQRLPAAAWEGALGSRAAWRAAGCVPSPVRCRSDRPAAAWPLPGPGHHQPAAQVHLSAGAARVVADPQKGPGAVHHAQRPAGRQGDEAAQEPAGLVGAPAAEGLDRHAPDAGGRAVCCWRVRSARSAGRLPPMRR